ncbi:MAG: DNA photolyase family protein [Saprospiraceae bacterium]|nr:DNA photolyase family protein [Saprospiraceae bacterium]
MNTPESHSLFWFRRDLRLDDNHGLALALKSGNPVVGCFIFDPHILDRLEDRDDARVTFIHQRLQDLQKEIQRKGGQLLVRYGKPETEIPMILQAYHIAAIYTNHDEDPYGRQRDLHIQQYCEQKGIAFHTCKDHLIFERSEVLKPDGKPYTVFTPYARKWKQCLMDSGTDPEGTPRCMMAYTSERIGGWRQGQSDRIPALADMGFVSTDTSYPEKEVPRTLIEQYDQNRDFPAVHGTSKLGMHLRFGTISIRAIARKAFHLNETYLNELIWREFYAMILFHFPGVVTSSFRPGYDQIEWINSEDAFQKWCEGKTGYPLVDAGMRQLNATGYMHNRVRMVAASFLTKHLLIDWRWGEAYFARKLLDFELASNNGGWQWAAGCGTDAAPYFRIFNPTTQQKKFDPDCQYIKTWIEEWGTPAYPVPLVDHAFARERCLQTYRSGLNAHK